MFFQGKFYLLIEELSQLFRALVPIQLWYKYIMGEDPSNSYLLGATLIIIYSLCKVNGAEYDNLDHDDTDARRGLVEVSELGFEGGARQTVIGPIRLKT